MPTQDRINLIAHKNCILIKHPASLHFSTLSGSLFYFMDEPFLDHEKHTIVELHGTRIHEDDSTNDEQQRGIYY